MKKIFKRIVTRIKKWNKYWAFIEEERMSASKYTGSSGPLL